MAKAVIACLVGLCALSGAAFAQAQPPAMSDAARALVGNWELSNADRDMICPVAFRASVVRGGFALEWDKECANVFPLTKDITAWSLAKNDAVQFLDTRGRILLELTEVESGLYEGLRPGDPLYFLQSQAAVGHEKTAQNVAGEWNVVRGAGKPICQLTLSGNAAANDTLALTVKPGCDAAIANFQPRTWQMDRGQLVIQSARGETWRFEEGDADTWQRIPAGRQPLSLVRQ